MYAFQFSCPVNVMLISPFGEGRIDAESQVYTDKFTSCLHAMSAVASELLHFLLCIDSMLPVLGLVIVVYVNSVIHTKNMRSKLLLSCPTHSRAI